MSSRTLWEYERYEMKQDEIRTGLAHAKNEGIAIGEERGELKKARETALNAIDMGLSTEQISKLTGLSEEEIQNIKRGI